MVVVGGCSGLLFLVEELCNIFPSFGASFCYCNVFSITENTFFSDRFALSEVMSFSAFATGDSSCCAFICFVSIDKASITLNNVDRIFQEDPIRRDIKFVDCQSLSASNSYVKTDFLWNANI